MLSDLEQFSFSFNKNTKFIFLAFFVVIPYFLLPAQLLSLRIPEEDQYLDILELAENSDLLA